MQRLVCLFLLLTTGLYAQEFTFNQVETQSLVLYEKSDWNGLISWEQTLKNQNIDYYHYNVRLGVAYFKVKDYYGAEKYFNKSIQNNSTDFALEYLYWTYINLGQINRAKEIHIQLSDEVRKKILNENKYIESVYLEGGVKFSNNYLKGNLEYASVSIAHRVNHQFTFVSGAGAILQKSLHDKVDQYQYNIFPSYYLKNGYTVNAGFMYAYNKFIGDHRIPSKTNINETVNNHTDAKINNMAYHIAVSKQYKRLYSELYGFYLQQNFKGTHTNIYEAGKDEFSAKTYILGVNISYVLPVLQNRFALGSMIFSASDSNTKNMFLAPYFSVRISPDIFMKTIYYPVNKTLFVDKEAGIFFTNNNLQIDRIASIWTWSISKKWQLVGTYSYENIISDLPHLSHHLNSCFAGVNYTF